MSKNAWGLMPHITDGWIFWDTDLDTIKKIRVAYDSIVAAGADKETVRGLLADIYNMGYKEATFDCDEGA